jgi:hypothetical protein
VVLKFAARRAPRPRPRNVLRESGQLRQVLTPRSSRQEAEDRHSESSSWGRAPALRANALGGG